VRTVVAWKGEKTPDKVEFTELRGMDGIREATINVAGTDVKIGIAHGLGNARKLLEDVRDGKVQYHAIEIMACPSGCVGGGGQPYHHNNLEVLKTRAGAIYKEDSEKSNRVAHENPEIKQLYDEFLGERYGELAHKLLHTKFTEREKL
ncbi:MAG: iron hydrogenase small subunit, partial [Firmicutes bacterium]|nr:iron hydrogenase small subunit [Bacillota bacterium]